MLIATIPPYVRHRDEIAKYNQVGALRFNTIMPISQSRFDVLYDLKKSAGDKPLWIDLKCRQLRITGFSYLPYSFIEISHKISVDLPAKVLFKDCEAEIVDIVDGNKLILSGRPTRVVGAGEPINIPSPTLKIEGFLTESDVEYLEVAKKLELNRFMLSFTQQESDLTEVLKIYPEAELMAKIEDPKGVLFASEASESLFSGGLRLMAARDDLYINTGGDIFRALREILAKDRSAVCASRVLTSLEKQDQVSLQDLSDIRYMIFLGYKNFMLSDGLCFSRDSFRKAMGVWGSCWSLLQEGYTWNPPFPEYIPTHFELVKEDKP